MEIVVSAKVPTRQPNGKVVTHAEEPNNGEVGKRNNARPVGYVSQPLSLRGGKTALVSNVL